MFHKTTIYIHLLENEEITTVMQGFLNIAAFPRVLLVIDGTHIRIQSPGGNQAEWFRNRKGFFSINAMVACEHKMCIRNIKSRFENGTENCLILST